MNTTVREMLIEHIQNPDEEVGAYINVDDVIELWLDNHEYDGLVFPGECGCGKDNLIACGESCLDCQAAYKVPIPSEEAKLYGDSCEWYSLSKKQS